MTTLAQISAVAPRLAPTRLRLIAAAIDRQAEKYNVPEAALPVLIGHMAHESMGFTRWVENMSYTAKRIVQVWPSRFPTIEAARPFARNPRALANKVYNGRMGNRRGSDDGWMYRGSGPLQHTGRAEFARVKARAGFDVVSRPDDLRNPDNLDLSFAAGLTYMLDRPGLLRAALDVDVVGSTRLINGGTIGLADRRILIARARAAARGAAPAQAVRTTIERKARAERQAATVATSGTMAGTAPAIEQNVNPTPIVSHGAAIVVGGAVLALTILAVVWLARRAGNLATQIAQDRAATAGARVAEERNAQPGKDAHNG